MVKMAKRILLCLLVFCTLSANAMAADVPVIVQLGSLGNILNVLNVLGGTLLDQVPGTKIYLLKLPSLPIVSSLTQTLLGITSIEADKIVAVPGRSQTGVLTVGQTTAPDWYKAQPELQRIRTTAAQAKSRGAGIVIADLNSSLDFAHPALAGHLTGGYDFVGARAGYAGILNQADASFLDQADASFLDQADTGFLDQADASFLDQADASFLDQTVAPVSTIPAYARGCTGLENHAVAGIRRCGSYGCLLGHKGDILRGPEWCAGHQFKLWNERIIYLDSKRAGLCGKQPRGGGRFRR